MDGSESVREVEPCSLALAAGSRFCWRGTPPKGFSAEQRFGDSIGIFVGKDSYR